MVLKKKAQLVLKVTEEEKKLIEDMIETFPLVDGVGLAAPQVGVSRRIAVVKDMDEDKILVLVNPVVIKKSGRASGQEGCLSLPGFTCNLKRWKEITIRYADIEGKTVTLEAKNLLARIIQHELDHLNGILIVDRVSFFKRHAALMRFVKLK